SMSLGEREQMAWLSGTMARELDMDPDFPALRLPRPSMSLGEREQMAWLSGTMARELDMDPDFPALRL
ncbi:hypothetical protein VS883_29060, partial [Escherichia coli]